MPTITQTIETSIGGKRYSAANSFTGTHISTIDTTLSIGGGDTTRPIYAENQTDGDIKFIAFKCDKELSALKLRNGDGSQDIIDLVSVIPDARVLANKTYQIPGSADMPTLSGAQLVDVEEVLINKVSSTASEATKFQLSIVFDTSASDDIG
jgi:hypothetical protein